MLITFAEKRKSTLQCLILYGCIMNGEWSTVLYKIANLTRDNLEYISMLFPRYVNAYSEIVKGNEPDQKAHVRHCFGFVGDFNAHGNLRSTILKNDYWNACDEDEAYSYESGSEDDEETDEDEAESEGYTDSTDDADEEADYADEAEHASRAQNEQNDSA